MAAHFDTTLKELTAHFDTIFIKTFILCLKLTAHFDTTLKELTAHFDKI